jgi:hypothetical protein
VPLTIDIAASMHVLLFEEHCATFMETSNCFNDQTSLVFSFPSIAVLTFSNFYGLGELYPIGSYALINKNQLYMYITLLAKS